MALHTHTDLLVTVPRLGIVKNIPSTTGANPDVFMRVPVPAERKPSWWAETRSWSAPRRTLQRLEGLGAVTHEGSRRYFQGLVYARCK